MKTLRFNTNIKCGGCVAAVTPFLNVAKVESWNVDTSLPDKPLTVQTELAESEVIEIIKKAGYKAEPVK